MLDPQITPPTELPVTLAYVKANAIVDFPDDDAILDKFIQAAAAYLDGPTGVLGRALMPQSVVQGFASLSHCLRIPYGPVLAVTGVTYQDEDDVTQTITGWRLYHDTDGSYLHFPKTMTLPKTYDDRPDAVSVSYSAGYSGAGAVPEDIKEAIVLMASTRAMFREDVAPGTSLSNVPHGVHAKIEPHRRVGV